jgi:starch phosphorylase
VQVRRVDQSSGILRAGEQISMEVAVRLNGLSDEDIFVECLVDEEISPAEHATRSVYRFEATGRNDKGETLFALDLHPPLPGRQEYRIRVYPYHKLLGRRFEVGLMLWL